MVLLQDAYAWNKQFNRFINQQTKGENKQMFEALDIIYKALDEHLESNKPKQTMEKSENE